MDSSLPPFEPAYISLVLALCALLTKESAKMRALTDLLDSKGIISKTEIDRAIAEIPPQTMDEVSKHFQEDLKQLIAFYYQQLLPKPDGPIQ
jgi:hypothetical protein